VARPTKDADGADIIDYFLVEEDGLSRVDEVLGKPWTDEQLAETEAFDAPDTDEEEINKRIPVSRHPARVVRILAHRRTSTMSVYDPTRSPVINLTLRKRFYSQSLKADQMMKLILRRDQQRRREREDISRRLPAKFCSAKQGQR
jgi:hypothetical protein